MFSSLLYYLRYMIASYNHLEMSTLKVTKKIALTWYTDRYTHIWYLYWIKEYLQIELMDSNGEKRLTFGQPLNWISIQWCYTLLKGWVVLVIEHVFTEICFQVELNSWNSCHPTLIPFENVLWNHSKRPNHQPFLLTITMDAENPFHWEVCWNAVSRFFGGSSKR